MTPAAITKAVSASTKSHLSPARGVVDDLTPTLTLAATRLLLPAGFPARAGLGGGWRLYPAVSETHYGARESLILC